MSVYFDSNRIKEIRASVQNFDDLIKTWAPELEGQTLVDTRRHYQIMATLTSIDHSLASIAQSLSLLTIDKEYP